MNNQTSFWAIIILGVCALALLFVFFSSEDMYGAIGYALFMAYAIGLEIFVLLLLGLIWRLRSRNAEDPLSMKTQSRHFFLAALMVLLVGFSLCFGGGALISA